MSSTADKSSRTASAGSRVQPATGELIPRASLPGPAGTGRLALRSGVMPASRMSRDEFYAAMAPHDDARLRKILWTVYWRANASSSASASRTSCARRISRR
jgi:hypothetical protein